MYIDYIEFYDEASVYEGKLPHYSKAGLTGEWTFPADNPHEELDMTEQLD